MKKSFNKFLQKTTKSLLFTILLLGGVLLQSCNNFLDGGDFKEQLDKDIAYAEAKECTLIVASNASLGSFLSAGEKTCKVKYTTDVQFTVNSDDYIFKGLEAVNSKENSVSMAQYVEFKTLESDEKNGTYKIQIKLLKESNDILIRPVCILIPKVAEITPKLESSGCDQDSSIKITFNKAMNPETFGDFSCISISSDGVPLDDYFETPYFSEDKTALYIQPHCGNDSSKLLLTPDGAAEYKNISVEVNFTTGNEKDADGIAIASNAAHKYKINKNYGNLKKVKITLESDENMGSFVGLSQIECVVGYSVEVQFKVKKDSYIFKGLEANGSAEELESKLKFEYESESGSEVQKVRVRVAEDCGDITLKPNCLLLPKIAEITPKYESSGCDQDSTIVIKFNKELNPDTFGDFSCISVKKSDGTNLKAYFGTPFFAADNMTLSIPTVKGKFIIDAASAAEYADVIVSLDSSNLKDSDGLSLFQSEPYTYRVNKNVDNVVPVLTSCNVYSTSDAESPLYKELTDKAFAKWTDSDFTKNHVSGSVYFTVCGYDASSGVNALRVTETIYKTANGANGSGATVSKTYYNKTLSESSEDNSIYKFELTHILQSLSDGIIKLDFELLDYSENLSTAKTYYVIKDTAIDESVIKFDQTKKTNFINEDLSWNWGSDVYKNLRQSTGNNETVKLSISSIPQDTFYSTYKTDYNIVVKWGYSKEDISNTATKTTSSGVTTFTFTHNKKQDTFVKTIVSDAAGNTKEIMRVLPSQVVISKLDWKKTQYYDSTAFTYANDFSLYKSLLNYYGASDINRWYFIKNTTDGDASWYMYDYTPSNFYCRDTGTGNPITSKSNGKTFLVYSTLVLQYGDSNALSEFWISSLSDEYAEVKVNSEDANKYDSCKLMNSGTSGLNKDYIVDNLKVATEPVLNSGCYKVVLDDEFLDRVTLDKTGITYSVIARKFNGESVESEIASADFTFYLPSPGKYDILLKAENSSKQFVTSSNWRYLLINGTGSNQERFLNFTDDLTPPILSTYSDENFYSKTLSVYYNDYYYVKDEEGGSGLVKDSSGKVLLDYYLIPCSSSTFTKAIAGISSTRYMYTHDTFTLEELEGKYSHLKNTIAVTPTEDYGSVTLKIPFDGADEGLYTFCVVAKDNNGNYAVTNRTAFNKRLGREFNFTYASDYIKSDPDTEFEVWYAKGDYINRSSSSGGSSYPCGYESPGKSSDNTWYKLVPFLKNGGSVADSGFYDVTYICFGYQRQFFDETAAPMTVSCKNVIPGGWNGLQIQCDAPTFAHTMYCKKNLSTGVKDTDVKKWENCAQETGYKEGTSNFTYGDENYDAVPSGYYYTTIVHFADGTTLMSEVKQK